MNKLKLFLKKIENRFDYLYNKFTDLNSIKNILFYVGFICIILINCDTASHLVNFNDNTKQVLRIISIVLFILKIILTPEKLWKYIKFLFIFLSAVIIDNTTNLAYETQIMFLMIFASRKINVNKVIKFLYIFNTIFLCIHIISYFTNLLGILNIDIPDMRIVYRGDTFRHNFFMYHPNTFSNYLFWTYLMFVYLNFNNKQMEKKIIFLGILFAIFTYIYPNTRNACMFYILAIIILYIYKNKKILKNEIFQYLNSFSFIYIFCISFILLFLFNGNTIFDQIVFKINDLISNRIELATKYLHEYGISIFGNNVSDVRNFLVIGKTNFIVDNWYYYIMIRKGIIFTLIFCYFCVKTSTKMVENKDYSKLYVILVFLLFNCIEGTGNFIQLSFPFLFFGLFL